MEAVVAHQIWNYIGMLGVDRETARDLYQEAETAIWEAIAHRQTTECHSYQVQTGIGAIRHWLRDRYSLVRIPGYLHDRGEATSHMKTIVPLEDMTETVGHRFEEDVLDQLEVSQFRQRVLALLPRLTRAEREVMEALLSGHPIREIARERKVRVGCVYAQRSKAIVKMRRLLAQEEQETLSPFIDRLEEVKSIILEIGQRNGNGGNPAPKLNDLLAEVASRVGLSVDTARVRLRKLNQRYPGLVAMKHRRYLPSTYYIRPEAIAESQKKVVPSVAPVQSARTPAPRQTPKPRKRETPKRQPQVWLLEAKTGLSRQEIEELLPLLAPCLAKMARNLLSGASAEVITEVMRYRSERFSIERSMTAQALRRVKTDLTAMSQDGHPFRQTLEEETGLSREQLLVYLPYLPEDRRRFAALLLAGKTAREIALETSLAPKALCRMKEIVIGALERIVKDPEWYQRASERGASYKPWKKNSLEAKTRLSRQRINDYLPKLRERHRELATLLLAERPQEEIRQAMGYDAHRFGTARHELVCALKNLAAGKEPYGWLKPITQPPAQPLEQAA